MICLEGNTASDEREVWRRHLPPEILRITAKLTFTREPTTGERSVSLRALQQRRIFPRSSACFGPHWHVACVPLADGSKVATQRFKRPLSLRGPNPAQSASRFVKHIYVDDRRLPLGSFASEGIPGVMTIDLVVRARGI